MTSLDQLPAWPEPPTDFTLPLSTAPNDVALRVYDYATVAALRARLELACDALEKLQANVSDDPRRYMAIALTVSLCREPKP